MALHPSGRFLYLITETTDTTGAYAIDPGSGALTELQFVDARPPGFTAQPAAADLHVTPDGRFLYGSERKTSTLVGYRIDPDKGTLSPIGHWPTEKTPRGFNIDPRGRFLLSVGLDSERDDGLPHRPAIGRPDAGEAIPDGQNAQLDRNRRSALSGQPGSTSNRRPRESEGPRATAAVSGLWIPAFAGMTSHSRFDGFD